jgi:hypothetical protein
MTRIILTYGLISGFVVISIAVALIAASGGAPQGGMLGMALGYLTMLVALSSILVGVKQYRDQALGGVIRFRTALVMGLGIAAVASLAYVIGWEAYLAATDYGFMEKYVASTLEARRASLSAADYQKLAADMETMRLQYADPLFRLPMTFVEIFPVGLLIALVSAALLRNPRFLPARAPVAAA